LLSAGLVALAIVAVWGVPAMVETHGQFFSVGIGEHVVQRGVERFNGRGYSPWFYLTTAPLSLFPWFGFAACAYVALRRESHARTAWLVSWLAAPYLIFTGYATQLPHYVLPAFPAFFLLVARGWSNAPAWARQLGAGIAAVFGFAAVIAAFWVIRADIPPEAAPLRVALLGAFGVFVGLASAALVFALATEFRDNPQVLEPVAASASEPTDHRDVTASHAESSRALVDRLQTGWLPLAAWLMLAVLLVVGGELALAGGLRQASLAVNVFPDPQAIAADTRIVALDFAEPSLVARAGRPVTFADDPREVMQAAEKPGVLVIVSVAREIDPLRLLRGTSARKWRAGTHAIDEAALPGTWHRKIVHGLNLGRTRWQELVVLERQTPNLVEPRADTNAHERSSRAKPQMNSDGHGFRPSQD
jgi:4-amino-4-deoxy-L-arabinose transferase-like glycosyltransferase